VQYLRMPLKKEGQKENSKEKNSQKESQEKEITILNKLSFIEV